MFLVLEVLSTKDRCAALMGFIVFVQECKSALEEKWEGNTDEEWEGIRDKEKCCEAFSKDIMQSRLHLCIFSIRFQWICSLCSWKVGKQSPTYLKQEKKSVITISLKKYFIFSMWEQQQNHNLFRFTCVVFWMLFCCGALCSLEDISLFTEPFCWIQGREVHDKIYMHRSFFSKTYPTALLSRFKFKLFQASSSKNASYFSTYKHISTCNFNATHSWFCPQNLRPFYKLKRVFQAKRLLSNSLLVTFEY